MFVFVYSHSYPAHTQTNISKDIEHEGLTLVNNSSMWYPVMPDRARIAPLSSTGAMVTKVLWKEHNILQYLLSLLPEGKARPTCQESNHPSLQLSAPQTDTRVHGTIKGWQCTDHLHQELNAAVKKLYSRSEQGIDSLIHLTRIYNEHITLSFILNKCGHVVTKRGKVMRTEGVDLPEGSIADM